MSRPSPCTPDDGAGRRDGDGKDAAFGEKVAPSATVTWGQQEDRIFAMTETTDAQLARVREEEASVRVLSARAHVYVIVTVGRACIGDRIPGSFVVGGNKRCC